MPGAIRRFVGAGAAFLVAVGALDAAAQTTSNLRAANLKPDIQSPEGGLWGLSDRAEAYVRMSAELNRDPALNTYVRKVVCRVGSEYCGEIRVYVLDRPPLNAAAAPNGYLEVNSGLLLRARTEDELAYVLGHEVTHFARNHSLARWNRTKTTANVVLVLQAGVTVGAAAAMYSSASSGAPNAGSTIDSISQSAQALNNLIYLQGLATIFAFSREQETEADALGLGRAGAAGYGRTAGADIWTALIEETEASDFPKVRKAGARASIFQTHPLTAERIAALKTLAGEASASENLDAERAYRANIRPHLSAWLRNDLRRRDFGQSLYLIERLEGPGEDLGLLAYYRGEAHRLRRHEGDAEAALAAYRLSVTHADAPPVAWRELGDAQRRAGDRRAAADSLQTYLSKAPDAEDRWLVEASLKTLMTELK